MKKIITTVVLLALIAVVSIVIITEIKADRKAPGTDTMTLAEFYGIDENKTLFFIDNKVYKKEGVFVDGHPYMDLESVQTLFNHRFFWSADEKLLVLTTPTQVIQITPGEKQILVNDKKKKLDFAPTQFAEKELYISIEYLAGHADMTYSIFTDPNRVIIDQTWGDYLFSTVKEKTQVRTERDVKAPIIKELEVGDKLRYIDRGGIVENGFVKVMTEDGVRGFVTAEFLSEGYNEEIRGKGQLPEYTHIRHGGPVFLGWEMLYSSDSKSTLLHDLEIAPELNVVSPSWFNVKNADGEITSIASQSYMEAAADQGVKVWAMIKNDSIEGGFKCTEDSHKVLSKFASRHTLIENIMNAAEEHGLDGINVDFEMLQTETGVYYIEFLRELSVACRKAGITLSVDNYVPAPYNAFYDLKEQGEIVDYVVIMGYDEHYNGSEESGSVASLPWFGDAIDNTVKVVNPDQVVMAIPFYTRLWKEIDQSDGSVSVSVAATPDMKTAKETLAAYGVEPEWDEETGQYYGEYTSKGARYRMWLEEEESLTRKVTLIGNAGLAGVAAWRLGYERPGIWETVTTVYDDSIQ
ncbi:MAG: hypothetical protein ILP10_05545 [Lachnospiraceae bacterium]|nr:hypothetical protein [Lachnospiraceae bacterium]